MVNQRIRPFRVVAYAKQKIIGADLSSIQLLVSHMEWSDQRTLVP